MDAILTIAAAYVAFTTWSILWIALKGLTSDFRARRRITKLGPENMAFPLTQPTNPNRRIRLVVVHGTWSLRGSWHQRESRFLNTLRAVVEQSNGSWEVEIERFLWSGGNTMTDRDRAYKRFVSEVVPKPGVETFILAHSHGGNIVLRALHEGKGLGAAAKCAITVATPFLCSQKRQFVFGNLLAIVSAAIVSAAAMFCLVRTDLIDAETREMWPPIWGLIGLFIFVLMKLQARRLGRSIPCEVSAQSVLNRLVIVRAAGDEAGASLGAAYILAYAGRVIATTIAAVATYPVKLLGTILRGEPDSKPKWAAEFCSVMLGTAAAISSAVYLDNSFDRPLDYLLATVVAGSVWVVFSHLVVWCGRTLLHVGRLVTHGIVETLIGWVLLPFGVEMAIASPLIVVSAEAAPPISSTVGDALPIIQFPLRRTAMQHSFDAHATAISEVVVRTVARHC